MQNFRMKGGRTVGMPGAQNIDKHLKTFLRELFHCCVQFKDTSTDCQGYWHRLSRILAPIVKDTGTDCQGYWHQSLVFNLKM